MIIDYLWLGLMTVAGIITLAFTWYASAISNRGMLTTYPIATLIGAVLTFFGIISIILALVLE